MTDTPVNVYQLVGRNPLDVFSGFGYAIRGQPGSSTSLEPQETSRFLSFVYAQ
jgi:hypothetical protein